jgi:hypothetical protein
MNPSACCKQRIELQSCKNILQAWVEVNFSTIKADFDLQACCLFCLLACLIIQLGVNCETIFILLEMD